MDLENFGVLLQMTLEHIDIWMRLPFLQSIYAHTCMLICLVTFFLLMYRIFMMIYSKDREIEHWKKRTNEEFMEKNNLYRDLKKLQESIAENKDENQSSKS